MENNEQKNINNNENDSRKKLDILKNDIYKSIANEFNISKDTAEKLTNLKKETWYQSHNSLKKELESNTTIDSNDKNKILSLTSERLNSLYNAISWAEKLTRKEYIDSLEIVKIWNKSALSKKLFPKMYDKSVDPENKSDQIIWFCLWWLDSCFTTIKFLFDIWSWIIKTPNHTYLVISWKWEYKKLDKNTFILAFGVSLIIIFYIIYYYII